MNYTKQNQLKKYLILFIKKKKIVIKMIVNILLYSINKSCDLQKELKETETFS